MVSVFLVGFVMGLRHAFEADHLAAVASLATRSRGMRAGILHGAAWGLGHTLTLLLVGGTCLLLGRAVPERWAQGLELLVGVMLVVLGADVLRRLRRRRVHVHVHEHEDGTRHWHPHQHAAEARHDPSRHEHLHPVRLPGRALAVGLVHGMAGSAALFLLTLETVPSLGAGLAYIALFGAGSILGMAGLSAAILVPLQAAAHLVGRVQVGLEAVVGAVTVAVGIHVVCQTLW
ncbi:MAG TPA: urease accessory protein [Vicinamibacteria bacterium]|jgi:MFS family permease